MIEQSERSPSNARPTFSAESTPAVPSPPAEPSATVEPSVRAEPPAPVESSTPAERHSTTAWSLPQTAELAEVLLEARLTIAVAESLTGGLLTGELASVPGISAVLQGGIVAYQTPFKHHLLGVDSSLLEREGPVAAATAIAMAQGVRRAFKQQRRLPDLGVSTTGVAGPGWQDGKAPGTVFVGIDSVFGRQSIQLDFSTLFDPADPVLSRQRIRQAAVEAAIFNVAEHLASR